MRKIKLSQKKYAIVDDIDYAKVVRFRWSACRYGQNWYAVRTGPRPQKKKFYMHRLILKTPARFVTDHRNGNGLDNRRSNLRRCTQSENMQNIVNKKKNKHGVPNLAFDGNVKMWRFRFTFFKRIYSFGSFSTKSEARNALRFLRKFLI